MTILLLLSLPIISFIEIIALRNLSQESNLESVNLTPHIRILFVFLVSIILYLMFPDELTLYSIFEDSIPGKLALIAGLADIMGSISYVLAIAVSTRLSSSVQILGFIPTFVVLTEVLIFDEIIAPLAIMGILITCIGILVIGKSEYNSREGSLEKSSLPGYVFFGITAILFSVRPILFRYAISSSELSPISWTFSVIFYGSFAALLFILFKLLTNPTGLSTALKYLLTNKRKNLIITIVITYGLTLLLMSFAAELLPGSIASSIRRSAPLLVAIYAVMVLKEKSTKFLWIGGTLIIIGIIFIV